MDSHPSDKNKDVRWMGHSFIPRGSATTVEDCYKPCSAALPRYFGIVLPGRVHTTGVTQSRGWRRGKLRMISAVLGMGRRVFHKAMYLGSR